MAGKKITDEDWKRCFDMDKTIRQMVMENRRVTEGALDDNTEGGLTTHRHMKDESI